MNAVTATPVTTATSPAIGGLAIATPGQFDLVAVLLFFLAAAIVLTPLLLTWANRPPDGPGRATHGFFSIPYITWYLLHYIIAALGILAVVVLGFTRTLTTATIAALLGSLFGYILGSATHATTSTHAAEPLTITTTSPLPDGTLNQPCTQSLAATGGAPPYTWTLLLDALPAGLTLDATGSISGTPTTAGDARFAIRVTDHAGASVDRVLTLRIRQP